MANTTIIVTSAEADATETRAKLDAFRATLVEQQIQHSYSEQTRWTWPNGGMLLEYVWRYDFPEGIEFGPAPPPPTT